MSVLLFVWLAALSSLFSPGIARAGTDSEEARAYFDKATASFALGRYPAAAENFEKAFELKPDPALLYNAAQAHRLAGNKERALILYQNYLRLYAKAGKRSEVEGRVEELKKAIEHDRVVATSPPTTTMPSAALPGSPAAVGEPTGAAAPPAPTASKPGESAAAPPAAGTPVASAGSAAPAVDLRPAPPPSSPPEMVTRADSGESKSLTQKPLFWAVVAGGVATVVVVVLVVALSGPKDPSPSLGVVR